MEESISTTPSTLGGNEGGVLVKVQSQKDSEMYRIAKVEYYSRCTYRAVWWGRGWGSGRGWGMGVGDYESIFCDVCMLHTGAQPTRQGLIKWYLLTY